MEAEAAHPAPGLTVWQPTRGFRYGAEAFWLVGAAIEGGLPLDALDLGTGSGVMAMLLAARGVRSVGLDLRPEWAPLWARTVADSRPVPVELRLGDVREAALPKVDLVVCNPPFFPAGSGPVSPNPLKAAARTESTATLDDFVRVGLSALRPAGRMWLVVPREREASLLERCSRWVRVGARRTVFELGGARASVPEQHDEGWARAWVALACGQGAS